MLYTAKCFWPGVTEDEVRLAAARAREIAEWPQTTFRGALYLPGDELVLCLFDAPSREECVADKEHDYTGNDDRDDARMRRAQEEVAFEELGDRPHRVLGNQDR